MRAPIDTRLYAPSRRDDGPYAYGRGFRSPSRIIAYPRPLFPVADEGAPLSPEPVRPLVRASKRTTIPASVGVTLMVNDKALAEPDRIREETIKLAQVGQKFLWRLSSRTDPRRRSTTPESPSHPASPSPSIIDTRVAY